ncbi:MAG: lysine-2,3-aminomutase-like protein [Alphaproteobacteria bacterium]|nr:lysine-2,3-aminomutase-like protein [Alphaproteobacteria bacterium]
MTRFTRSIRIAENENPLTSPLAERVAARFEVGVTDHVLKTMVNPDDPVGKQYVPDIRELKILPDESPDPIGDNAHTPVKGLVHRYPDRVLLKLTHTCAVYCRYCFRKEMLGAGTAPLKDEERTAAFDYIRNDKNIWEVILTGGDPLVLSPRRIQEALDILCDIEHVKVIRIHTRVPIADPARITEDLCAALKRDKAVYVAVHINHAQELTPEVERALASLRAADCVLLSQSVLLKGVNDDPTVLEDLFRRLAALRVKPYYLHHPDRAPGTSHFRVSLKRGREIVRRLVGRVSGICRPHYMLDIPGGHGKVPAEISSIAELETDTYGVMDFNGHLHTYRDGDHDHDH